MKKYIYIYLKYINTTNSRSPPGLTSQRRPPQTPSPRARRWGTGVPPAAERNVGRRRPRQRLPMCHRELVFGTHGGASPGRPREYCERQGSRGALGKHRAGDTRDPRATAEPGERARGPLFSPGEELSLGSTGVPTGGRVPASGGDKPAVPRARGITLRSEVTGSESTGGTGAAPRDHSWEKGKGGAWAGEKTSRGSLQQLLLGGGR